MVLGCVFSPDLIKIDLESEDKEEVFEELVDLYASKNPSVSRSQILASVRSREQKLSTGIKPGVAIPHAQTEMVSGVKGLIGISRKGIDYEALDGKPVHVVFLVLSSADSCTLYLRALRSLSLLLDDPQFIDDLMSQKTSDSLYATLCKFEELLTTFM